ncbi:hypothetical protein SPHINGOAX6_30108 [Sphingomonas sp. AX6]|nr:hypothetical protein SPHINGOAX6_30108 [Sphingomonas sp. AX6]
MTDLRCSFKTQTPTRARLLPGGHRPIMDEWAAHAKAGAFRTARTDVTLAAEPLRFPALASLFAALIQRIGSLAERIPKGLHRTCEREVRRSAIQGLVRSSGAKVDPGRSNMKLAGGRSIRLSVQP